MCRIRWPASLVLLLVLLLVPAPAMADETYVLGGFARGFGDLVSPGEVEQKEVYEDDFIYQKQNTRASGNEYKSVVMSAYQVDWGGQTKLSWFQSLRVFLGAATNGNANTMRNTLILPVIGIVFMWWGLRKSLRLISRVSKGRSFRI